MKKISVFFVVLLLTVFTFNANAQGFPVIDAILNTTTLGNGIESAIHFAQQIYQTVQSVQEMYSQTQLMIKQAERAVKNIMSVTDIRSFDDFMRWTNRQLYMAQDIEGRFNNLGVVIGGKKFSARDIDDIPGALRESFDDSYWSSQFTESQRMEMYSKLGLSPANFMYLQKWKQREDEFAKNAQFMSEINEEELQKAADMYNALAEEYAISNEDMDINQIMKNMHITNMRTELAIREMLVQMAKKNEYDVAQSKLGAVPANKPRLPDTYDADYWEPIAEGKGRYTD